MTRRLRRNDGVDDIFKQMQNMFEHFQEFGRDLDIGRGLPIDIRDEGDSVVITADMPGVEKENISLKADENEIEIAAESSHEIKEENEKYLRKERAARSYRRTVSWPTNIDPESITAKYQDGVLRIEAEKEDSDGGKSIEIE